MIGGLIGAGIIDPSGFTLERVVTLVLGGVIGYMAGYYIGEEVGRENAKSGN